MEPIVKLFGPVDAFVGPYIEFILLGLILVNMVGRLREYDQHVEQAEEGADALTRDPLRVGTNFLLVVGAFYYMTLHHHGGMVTSVLVLGLFITDLFEFESRKVEARQGWEIERPRASIAASFLALAYIAFQSVFFVVEPIWSAIV